MQPQAYIEMDRNEATHWWYVGRRAVLQELIAGLHLPADAQILEVGSGTGGNLSMLARLGRVWAWEPNETARAISRAKNETQIAADSLVQLDAPPTQQFDLICLLDVVEHLDEPVSVLDQLRAQLKPGGHLLVTVPAYQWMWSNHDALHEHRRRYSEKLLREQLASAGYQISTLGHFNSLLFPVAVAVRLLERLRNSMTRATGQASVGMAIPSAGLNRLLTKVFSSEAKTVARSGYRVGLSLFAISSSR